MVLHFQSEPFSTRVCQVLTGTECVLALHSFAKMRDVQTLLKRLKDCKILDEVSGVGVVRSFIGQ